MFHIIQKDEQVASFATLEDAIRAAQNAGQPCRIVNDKNVLCDVNGAAVTAIVRPLPRKSDLT
jgi:hypothetical protein